MSIFLWTITMLAFGISNSNAVSPSFDCNQASTKVEKLICSDEDLTKLDVEMDNWYKKVMSTDELNIADNIIATAYQNKNAAL